MSKRNEIIEGAAASKSRYGLIYTEVLGWIDLGHAQGDDIRKLLHKINYGEACSNKFYDVTYAQTMVSPWSIFKVGKYIRWRVRKGRPWHERKSIALAMMMEVARRFETFQGSFPNNLITDSGFSGEDLVSDLLGFYRVIGNENPFAMLRPVSQKAALLRWDHYGPIGSWKNETFRPLLFPDPKFFPHTTPYLGDLPHFMQSIRPYRDWASGHVAVSNSNGNFIQGGKEKDMY